MRAPERQEQILRCAKKVFAERGYHAANISHICAEAGIGRGTLYQYFDNKKAVFTSILVEILESVEQLVRERGPAPTPSPESLSRSDVVRWAAGRLQEVLETVFADEQALRILLREAVGLDVDVERLLGEIDAGLISVVARDLSDARAAGLVRRDINPQMTATLMVGGIEKLALASLRSDEPFNLAALSLEAARLHNIGIISDRVQPDVFQEDHETH